MVDSRQKGARAETQAKELLHKLTKLDWQRIPGSGALDAVHGLKGDLYVVNYNNRFCVEVKSYADDHICSKLLTGKNPQISTWWEQAVRQGNQVNKEPLLIFKFNRSKFFVATNIFPNSDNYRHLYFSKDEIYISQLEDWITYENPNFIRSKDDCI